MLKAVVLLSFSMILISFRSTTCASDTESYVPLYIHFPGFDMTCDRTSGAISNMQCAIVVPFFLVCGG
jgi:hypothetical protein